MTSDPHELMSRYLDDALTDDEHRELQESLRDSPQLAREFARLSRLHDQLRGELAASALSGPLTPPQRISPPTRPRRGPNPFAFTSAVVVSLLIGAAIWLGVGKTSTSAAAELNRLIAAQENAGDRTYRISLEEVTVPRSQRDSQPEVRRPPKPPIDGAVLHVRHGNQFVLIRQTKDGQPFVTGSDGRTSWAVRPDGPVRVSADLTRFNRDLPGHEHGIPLIQIEHGLEQLCLAYDVQLLPVENDDDPTSSGPPTRLLVAVKKRGHRGPQRVEITYFVGSGLIRQMRFVEMPYGPERLTLRLTLAEERNLGTDFFGHGSHHSPDRIVEEE